MRLLGGCDRATATGRRDYAVLVLLARLGSSTQGVSTVTVAFTTAANADLVGIDVERVVNGARSKLPAA